MEKTGSDEELTYDNSKYMVTVEDYGNGKLVASVVVTKDTVRVDNIEFVNVFTSAQIDTSSADVCSIPIASPNTGNCFNFDIVSLTVMASGIIIIMLSRKIRKQA